MEKDSSYVYLRMPEVHYTKFYENKLFFMCSEHSTNEDGEETFWWRSDDYSINIRSKNDGTFSGYRMFFSNKYENGECIAKIITGEISDWKNIFDITLGKQQNTDSLIHKNYAYKELLWSLDNLNWTADIINVIISNYQTEQRIYLLEIIRDLKICLNSIKQGIIIKLLNIYNIPCSSANNRGIDEALDICGVKEKSELNLFKKIDIIFDLFKTDHLSIESNNTIIQVATWLSDSEYTLPKYEVLINIIPFLSEDDKLLIIKRYFHDIRNKRTSINREIIEFSLDSKYQRYTALRHCIEAPSAPIKISSYLLCDCINNMIYSGGKELYRYNGIVDLAIQLCDIENPQIDFGLEKLLPKCNGIVKNYLFNGFLKYETIYTRTKSDEELKDVAIALFKKYGEKIVCCKHTGETISNNNNRCKECSLKQQKITCETINDKWLINEENEFLIFFTDKKFSCGTIISINDISIQKINAIIKQNEKISDCSIDYQKIPTEICFKILEPKYYIIMPNEKSVIGIDFDYFGKLNENEKKEYIRLNKNIYKLKWKEGWFSSDEEKEYISSKERVADIEEKFYEYESSQIKGKILNFLRSQKNLKEEDNNRFRLEYNPEDLRGILVKFHTNKYNPEDLRDKFVTNSKIKEDEEQEEQIEYAEYHYHENYYSKHNELIYTRPITWSKKYIKYCSPKFSEQKDAVLDKEWFWCNGRYCFKNSLASQDLKNTDDYTEYKLLHILEIIGYKKLICNNDEYATDDVIGKFIGSINRIIEIFKQFKCKECGHLIFPCKSGEFNTNNKYRCLNPKCTQYDKVIYINYCFNCQKGLIDSRETKKCNNGMYICPQCLSCCDENNIEKLISRYRADNKPIPDYIIRRIGKCHNDKGIFYCPKCGEQIVRYRIGNTKEFVVGCKTKCNIKYPQFNYAKDKLPIYDQLSNIPTPTNIITEK